MKYKLEEKDVSLKRSQELLQDSREKKRRAANIQVIVLVHVGHSPNSKIFSCYFTR